MPIVCTNCGVSGAQLANWFPYMERTARATAAEEEEGDMIGWPLRYDRILAGEKVENKEIETVISANHICCAPPYVVGRTEIPFEELMFRSLPRGEDR